MLRYLSMSTANVKQGMHDNSLTHSQTKGGVIGTASSLLQRTRTWKAKCLATGEQEEYIKKHAAIGKVRY